MPGINLAARFGLLLGDQTLVRRGIYATNQALEPCFVHWETTLPRSACLAVLQAFSQKAFLSPGGQVDMREGSILTKGSFCPPGDK